MFAMIVTTTVLAFLYGLAWHNESPRARHHDSPKAETD